MIYWPPARTIATLVLPIALLTGCGYLFRQGTIVYLEVHNEIAPKEIEIELATSFIERYKDRVGMDATFTVDKSMRDPAIRALDGDLHFAGRTPQAGLYTVGEIANADAYPDAVTLVHQADSTGRPLEVSGVWRVWPEHSGHGTVEQGRPLPPAESYRPTHVFEIHPVTRVGQISLLSSFAPVKGFSPGDAKDTFAIYEQAPCKLIVKPNTISIATIKGLYNDVEFIMELDGDPQRVVADGRFVMASALDMKGIVQARRVRMVFARDTPPDRAVRRLRTGDRLHVVGIPRMNFSELSRRLRASAADPTQLSRTIPYEIIVIGVFDGRSGRQAP
jgi:hypothetical protein